MRFFAVRHPARPAHSTHLIRPAASTTPLSGLNTAHTVRTDEQVRAFLRLLPRYQLLLYNDDRNTMSQVIAALLRTIPALTVAEAERITREAHTHGCALVIVCLRELAEHYRAQLLGYTLTSAIEPA
jgi:ATP-dependent Clp protease adaptor protein ClpS